MSFEQCLREEMETVSGLADKVFPVNAPESCPSPYAVYFSSEGTADKSLNEVLSSRTLDFSVHVISATYSEGKTITSGVVQRLQSFFQREIGVSNPIFCEDITIDPTTETWDNQLNMFRFIVDATIYI
jgi:hypothetical protein